MKNIKATIGNLCVYLTEEGYVPFFDGIRYLGRGFWDKGKRRIVQIPETVSKQDGRALSRALKLAVIAARIAKPKPSKVEIAPTEVRSLFRLYQSYATPV